MDLSRRVPRLPVRLAALSLLAGAALAQGPDQDGKVKAFARVTAGLGGFAGPLAPGDRFGDATAAVGDLDGNGIQDVAVGAPGTDDGGASRGAVWILFLGANGTVIGQQKISATAGGFAGTLADGDQLGTAVDAIGDLDGDGRDELAVGTEGEKLFVLFLSAGGTVTAAQEIAAGVGGFAGALDAGDRFGSSVGGLGDVDGDGIPDLAVGAPGDDDGGSNRGAAWVLFLDASGSVTGEQKLSGTEGNFGAGLSNGDALGTAVEGLEDMDGDGVGELAIGAPLTNGIDFVVPAPGSPPTQVAAPDEGVLFLVFLDASGMAKSKVEIGQGLAGFGGMPFVNHRLGTELTALGDLDGNGVRDLAAGMPNRNSSIGAVGGFYELFLAGDGTVVKERLVTDKQGGFNAGMLQFLLLPGDTFDAPAYVRDLDADCLGDLVVGAAGDDVAGADAGAIWVLRLFGDEQASASVRNGSGANALAYATDDDPRLGRTWVGTVDVGGHPGATISALLGVDQPAQFLLPPLGEVLVDLGSATQFVDVQVPVGGVATHSLAIPFVAALAGLQVYSQPVIGGGAGPELVNAIDLKIGF